MPSSNFTPYLEYTKVFAATDAKDNVPEIPFIPFKQLYLITCIDPGGARSRAGHPRSARRSSRVTSAAA